MLTLYIIAAHIHCAAIESFARPAAVARGDAAAALECDRHVAYLEAKIALWESAK